MIVKVFKGGIALLPGHAGQTLEKKQALNLAEISQSATSLLEICSDCVKKMACFHPSAFHADDIREAVKMSGKEKGGPGGSSKSRQFYNDNSMELNPLKYNSKLMNSIWGNYNRYSPHNVKKNNDAASSSDYVTAMQKLSASAVKAEALKSFDKMWASFNTSHAQ